MRIKKYGQYSLADQFITSDKLKETKIDRLNHVINWSTISHILQQHYQKGKSNTGRIAHDPLVLFKMVLLQTWHNLSDEKVEEMLNDRLSFMRFCGLQVNDPAPDHATLSRFRTFLAETNMLEELLHAINKQLTNQGILLRTGILVDASITESERKPKKRKASDSTPQDKDSILLKAEKPCSGDREGSWLSRPKKAPRFGYKRLYAVDAENGLVLSVATSKASSHESPYLPKLLGKLSLPRAIAVYTDKGYAGEPNNKVLEALGCRNRIQKKAKKGKQLSLSDRCYNRLIGKFRYRIEQVFGSIKRWFGGNRAKYVGLKKVHFQHVLEAISYNLYRLDSLLTIPS